MGNRLKVEVLGPLGLSLGGVDAVPSAPKERQVLAVLLLNESRVVPVSALIDELWGDEPPKSALTTVQTYIVNIRKTLVERWGLPVARVRGELLTTVSTGYRFNTDHADHDLREYRRLVAAGRQAFHAGDEEGGVELLRRAEELRRGPVLVDVKRGRHLDTEIAGLEQAHLTVQESRIEAQLRLGEHRELLGELFTLTPHHPYHEHLHGYLMLSLHRCGRRNQALEVFRGLRESMVRELGLEPSPWLLRLQRDILRSVEPADPGLSAG
ncbi:AfsR/SARP family transcriptional regulator [Saccharothrix xinjiangensis]|uniref:AfsR/SARP family transcriptional regulator n=1 Tax=Saccharothrix xinjiangensis TaxID=204798 RepID=A0ABV9Y707_9PSEU